MADAPIFVDDKPPKKPQAPSGPIFVKDKPPNPAFVKPTPPASPEPTNTPLPPGGFKAVLGGTPAPLPSATPRAQVTGGLQYADPRERTDLLNGQRTVQGLVDGLSALEADGFKMTVTSVRSDHHDDGPTGHAGGKATDIGLINGVQPGDNNQTRAFLTHAIQSGKFAKIGATTKLVYDPEIVRLAAQHGVSLFHEGPETGSTGPHVHLQVSGDSQPAQAQSKRPAAGPVFVVDTPTPTNPMDVPGGQQATGTSVAPSGAAHSALGWLGGSLDLPFILENARVRDLVREGKSPDWTVGPFSPSDIKDPAGLMKLARDPRSFVGQALALYRRDPAAAMDEFGAGSSAQNKWVAEHAPNTVEGRYSDFMNHHAATNAVVTFFEEMFNPANIATGEAGGNLIHLLKGEPVLMKAGQTVAKGLDLGSPLSELHERAGVEGSQWAKGLIYSVKVEDRVAREKMLEAFKGLSQDEQWEVVRISQGLKPDPKYFGKSGLLMQRAKMLRDDIKHVTAEQGRVGMLRGPVHGPAESTIMGALRPGRPIKPGTMYNPETYFPMSNTLDYGPAQELERELTGKPPQGGTGTTAEFHKRYPDVDAWRASGEADENASAAVAYETWRRQRMQRVAFEDALQRAPESLRRDVQATDFERANAKPPVHLENREMSVPAVHPRIVVQPKRSLQPSFINAAGERVYETDAEALQRMVEKNNATYPEGHPQHITLKEQTQYVYANNLLLNRQSPTLARSMIAPELWKFFQKDGQFAKYVDQGGTMLPGEEQTFAGRLISIYRNAVVSNFFFHPTVNIAGNDAAARGLAGLTRLAGGFEETALPWELGGYAYNAAKALAMQVGLAKPEKFVGGAHQYAEWMDRALKAGAKAEFGTPKTSAMGAEAARLLTEPVVGKTPKAWLARLDKAMLRFNNFNMTRTFGDKGEAAFATSLFKDAVTIGKMSDFEAGQIVREALGDYANFDPKSKWSAGFLFMPWEKSNVKFWVNLLVRRPQYVTGPAHAIRDFNMQQGDPSLSSPFAPPDQRIYLGKDGQRPSFLPEYLTPPFVSRDVGKIAEGVTSPNEALFQAESLIGGRANPFSRVVLNAIQTGAAMTLGSKDVHGPETNYEMIFNPRAPRDVQFQQIAKYLASNFLPVPLVGYAVQDAARKGLSPKGLVNAFVQASGLGYGSDSLNEDQRKEVSRAQKRFLTDYYKATDPANRDQQGDLKAAWSEYISALKDAGVVF